MAKKKPNTLKNFTTQGISFQRIPIDILELAKKDAKANRRSLSNYLNSLILKAHLYTDERNG